MTKTSPVPFLSYGAASRTGGLASSFPYSFGSPILIPHDHTDAAPTPALRIVRSPSQRSAPAPVLLRFARPPARRSFSTEPSDKPAAKPSAAAEKPPRYDFQEYMREAARSNSSKDLSNDDLIDAALNNMKTSKPQPTEAAAKGAQKREIPTGPGFMDEQIDRVAGRLESLMMKASSLDEGKKEESTKRKQRFSTEEMPKDEQDLKEQQDFAQLTQEIMQLLSPEQRERVKKMDPTDIEFPLHLMRILEESEKEATADMMSNIPEHLRGEFEEQRRKIDEETNEMKKRINVETDAELEARRKKFKEEKFDPLHKKLPEDLKHWSAESIIEQFKKTQGDPLKMSKDEMHKGIERMMADMFGPLKAGTDAASEFSDADLDKALNKLGRSATIKDLEKLADEMIANTSTADRFSEQLKTVSHLAAKNKKDTPEYRKAFQEAGETLRKPTTADEELRKASEHITGEFNKIGMEAFSKHFEKDAELAKNGNIDSMLKDFMTAKPPTMTKDELSSANKKFWENASPEMLRELDEAVTTESKPPPNPLKVNMTVTTAQIPDSERDMETEERVRAFANAKPTSEDVSQPRSAPVVKPKLKTKVPGRTGSTTVE